MKQVFNIFWLSLIGFTLACSSSNEDHSEAKEAPHDVKQYDTVLVDILLLDKSFILDIRYATANNFLDTILYSQAKCFLRESVAYRLLKVQTFLREKGYGLKIFDGYRPHSVQKKMWSLMPDERYVANPAKGSNHNRGCAIDVSMVDLYGNDIPMPTAYDDFSERAHLDYLELPEEVIQNREILQDAMTRFGFVPFTTEWWHFDAPDCGSFNIREERIEEL